MQAQRLVRNILILAEGLETGSLTQYPSTGSQPDELLTFLPPVKLSQ